MAAIFIYMIRRYSIRFTCELTVRESLVSKIQGFPIINPYPHPLLRAPQVEMCVYCLEEDVKRGYLFNGYFRTVVISFWLLRSRKKFSCFGSEVVVYYNTVLVPETLL